ncbi:restriction endonuclease subunit S [Candidatus Saccharibacteria bacterium]|nr:restriction endonuclease subunit S [Candidatus Saccharibacteria bacterium]
MKIVKLHEIADISSGNPAPQKKELFINGKYPFFRTSDVGAVHLSDNLKTPRDLLNDEGIKGLRLFPKGTILFPKSGASTFLNHRVIMGIDGYVVSHLATIVPDITKVDTKYLYNFLIQIDAKDLLGDQSYPSLRTAEIGKIEIAIPSMEEQRKIVAKLDKSLSRITKAEKLLRQNIANVADLQKSILAEAFKLDSDTHTHAD